MDVQDRAGRAGETLHSRQPADRADYPGSTISGAGLNVPVRAMIYEDPHSGACRFAYDLPSSLMARLGNEKLLTAARRLDEKLAALGETVTGSPA